MAEIIKCNYCGKAVGLLIHHELKDSLHVNPCTCNEYIRSHGTDEEKNALKVKEDGLNKYLLQIWVDQFGEDRATETKSIKAHDAVEGMKLALELIEDKNNKSDELTGGEYGFSFRSLTYVPKVK